MKLVLKIALGVFLGSLASLLLMDAWHDHKAYMVKAETEKVLQEQERVGLEQTERIHAILMQGRQSNPAAAMPPPGFVPDDAHTETLKP
jgi:hypothetical protein